ncbi:MAG: hypothetical protein MJ239_03210 [Bacilli bacterium]|nr:hypothetical protein [Bacilli bacterium]
MEVKDKTISIASTWTVNGEMINKVSSIMEDVGILTDSAALAQLKEQDWKKPKIPNIVDPFDGEEYLDICAKKDKSVKELSPKCRALFGWAKKQLKTSHPILVASVMDYMLKVLGPSPKHNGEIASAYALSMLSEFRHIFAYFPIFEIERENKSAKEKAIEESGKKNDIAPYILFTLESIESAIQRAKDSIREIEGVPSRCVYRLLRIMRPGQAYGSKDLMERLGLKSRVAVKRNYLEPAMKLGLIKMTIPSKINSPLQRYIKVKKEEK